MSPQGRPKGEHRSAQHGGSSTRRHAADQAQLDQLQREIVSLGHTLRHHQAKLERLRLIGADPAVVSVIHWNPVSDPARPDADQNVLLGLADGTSCEGFLDFNPIAGTELWRDTCAEPLDAEVVTRWAYLPGDRP